MTDLSFEVLGDRVEPHAAVPTIMLRVRATEVDEPGVDRKGVHAAILRCQIRIEPNKRHYDALEEERLYEMFGETRQWGDSLRPFLWTHVSTALGGFEGSTEFDLPIECSYDFEVAGAKYLHALGDSDVPLLLLFSGTVFARRGDGPSSSGEGFAAGRVSWDSEASYRLPVRTWRAAMDAYFPNSAWVRLQRDTLDRLQHFRAVRGLPTWDQAIERLLKEAGRDGP